MTAERRIRLNRIRRTRQLRRRLALACMILCISVISGIIGTSFMSKAQSDDVEVVYKYYTSIMVQPGDTLYSIAENYTNPEQMSVSDYIDEVRVTNNLIDVNAIRSGDYLVVPYFSKEFR